jgi:hypothetical protein
VVTIKQRYEQDCFLCCLAMAIGMSYDDAASKCGPELADAIKCSGLSQRANAERAFNALDLLCGRDYIPIRSTIEMKAVQHHAELAKELLWGRRALIQVKSKNYDNRYHIVYWDGAELHDPSPLRTYTWEEVNPGWIWLLNDAVQHARAAGAGKAVGCPTPAARSTSSYRTGSISERSSTTGSPC